MSRRRALFVKQGVDFTNAFKYTNLVSDSENIVVPATGTNDFYINWGDGSAIEYVNSASPNHSYTTAGSYQIQIAGNMTVFAFNNGGNKLNITSLDQWGSNVWTTMAGMFYGCSNMVGNYVDSPNTSSVTNMSYMFSGCSAFNQSVSFDTSNVTNMSYMFYSCSAFNQSVSFDTSNVTTMSAMFSGCSAFKQSLDTFDMTSCADVSNMLFGCNINTTGTTTNYDATLVAWELQNLVDDLVFHAGTSQYSTTGQTAKNAIIADDNWDITDGGLAA